MRQTISQKYLGQLFRQLRHAGLLRAIRGAHGGYVLGKDPASISVRDILEGAGESLVTVDCLDETFDCPRRSVCVLRVYWKRLDSKIRQFLESTTLSDICQDSGNGGVDE